MTSTESRLKRSLRLVCALSRRPSTCMFALALKPRMLIESPEPPPPSPALKVMPETLDRACRRLSAFCSSSTWRGTTVMVCGTSSSGTAYLADPETSVLEPVTACPLTVTGASCTLVPSAAPWA